MTTTPPYQDVMAGCDVPTRFADPAMVTRYLDAGSPAGDLLYLGFGETWTQVAPGLAEALTALPRHAHGYIISQYGLPRLQRTLRSYIATTHRLPHTALVGQDYEVAASAGGTRNAMFDFARLLQTNLTLDAAAGTGRTPVVIAPKPGWDYAGVFTPLNYRMRYFPLAGGDDGQPSGDNVDTLLRQVAASPDERPAIVVVNAQHNPTGANWQPETVRHIIRSALDNRVAILLDDAYFGVHDPAVTPTSALRILLEELRGAAPPARRRWLAVRSLGKQFHCSGWGIGALTADPHTLEALVNDLQFQRSFASAIPLQEAMAAWLETAAAQRFLEEQGREYTAKRALVRDFLVSKLGYPPSCFQLGEFAPYARIQVPGGPGDEPTSIEEFRQACLTRAGVLVGVDGWSGDPDDPSHRKPPYYRLFLGPPQAVILAALTRLHDAGFSYRPKVSKNS